MPVLSTASHDEYEATYESGGQGKVESAKNTQIIKDDLARLNTLPTAQGLPKFNPDSMGSYTQGQMTASIAKLKDKLLPELKSASFVEAECAFVDKDGVHRGLTAVYVKDDPSVYALMTNANFDQQEGREWMVLSSKHFHPQESKIFDKEVELKPAQARARFLEMLNIKEGYAILGNDFITENDTLNPARITALQLSTTRGPEMLLGTNFSPLFCDDLAEQKKAISAFDVNKMIRNPRFAVVQANSGILVPKLTALMHADLSPDDLNKCAVLLTAMQSPPIPESLKMIDMDMTKDNLVPFFSGVCSIDDSYGKVVDRLEKGGQTLAPPLVKLLESKEGGLDAKQTAKCRDLLKVIQQPLLKELSSYIDEHKRTGPSLVDSWKKSGSQYSDKLGAAVELQKILMSVDPKNDTPLTSAQLKALTEPESTLGAITRKAMIFLPESVKRQLEGSLHPGKKLGT